uniref:Uncharacterized protein n=1 Tax=Rhizophora mucronata TaxID=61149 RepID=A0A2P2Q9I6_RHIMU
MQCHHEDDPWANFQLIFLCLKIFFLALNILLASRVALFLLLLLLQESHEA